MPSASLTSSLVLALVTTLSPEPDEGPSREQEKHRVELAPERTPEDPPDMTILLLMDSKQGERQVEVFHPHRALEMCQWKLKEAGDGAARQFQEEIEHPRVSQAQERCLVGKAFSRMMDVGGFSVRDISGSVTMDPSMGAQWKILSYRGTRAEESSGTNVMLQMELPPAPDGNSWSAMGAHLSVKGPGGARGYFLQIWQEPAPPPDGGLYLLLETEMEPPGIHDNVQLSLTLVQGSSIKGFTLTGIKFP